MTTAMTQRFQGQDLLRIGAGDSYLLLAPEHGGRLVRWVHRGEDILYWPDNADWTRVAKVRGGNPLLFPFIGRHFVDGEAGKWRDADGVVRDMPQHGFARDLPFAVTERSDDAVSLTLSALASSATTHAAYPFAFAFTVTYRLLPDGLEATFAIRNDGAAPLPHYAGHHFYFALPHGARGQSRLSLPAAARVRQLGDGSLTAPEPGDPTYTIDDARLQDTYHVLQGDTGAVRLELPSRTISIALDSAPDSAPNTPWYAVTTWTEAAESDFYCVEPWLGLPNAIDHRHGLHWVAAGTTASASCRLRIV